MSVQTFISHSQRRQRRWLFFSLSMGKTKTLVRGHQLSSQGQAPVLENPGRESLARHEIQMKRGR